MKKTKLIIIVIITIVLIVACITITTIKFFECKELKQQKESIEELLVFYTIGNECVSSINSISETLYNEWGKYIYDNEYSSISELYESVEKIESSNFKLVDANKVYLEEKYKNLKRNNTYYLTNNEIADTIDGLYNEVTEYYEFILSNSQLSYLSLSTLKNIKYKNCESQLKLLIYKLVY